MTPQQFKKLMTLFETKMDALEVAIYKIALASGK